MSYFLISIDRWKTIAVVFIWKIYDRKVSIYQRVWPRHTNKTFTYWGMLKQGKIKSKVSSFLPITTKRLIKNILDIQQSSLLASVTWEFGACGLNNVSPTIGMTAEVWRDWWGFMQPQLLEFKLILYSQVEALTNV